jgi:hypothetical protein
VTDEERRQIEWDLQPAEEPLDLTVTPEEREEIVYQTKLVGRRKKDIEDVKALRVVLELRRRTPGA